MPRTETSLSENEAAEYMARWARVREIQIGELDAMSAGEKLRRLATMMASAGAFRWSEELSADDDTVRVLWMTLRRRYDKH